MTDVAAISEYTYHGLSEQKIAHQGMPIFILPDDISALFRQTRRNGSLEIHVLSFGILAKTEAAIKDFAEQCKKRRANISSKNEDCRWRWNDLPAGLVGLWRNARVKGSAKIGARIVTGKQIGRAHV